MIGRRRFLLTSLTGALARPLAARAQQTGKVYRVGLLSPARPASPSDPAATRHIPVVLRELGYVEGDNLVIERRFADGKIDRLPGLARELVKLQVDVILAVSASAVQAAREATSTIPIVMGFSSDPVGRGFASSLARPGANITGVALAPENELVGKRLELLRIALPRGVRVAVLSTADPSSRTQVAKAREAAEELDLRLVIIEVP